MSEMLTSTEPVLLVEDDLLDVKSVRRAFKMNGVTNPLHVATNGEEALEYLRSRVSEASDGEPSFPRLILLDINMPVMNGLEFLVAYKSDDAFKHIPAVVLTTSTEEHDRLESYRNGIAGYIVKPVDFEAFREAIRRFDRYWAICELP